jgi:hypothetical protein
MEIFGGVHVEIFAGRTFSSPTGIIGLALSLVNWFQLWIEPIIAGHRRRAAW